MANDLRTKAIVLRRTNYGEADRILQLLTPEGKMSVLAKGVRKERSKLAGGVEMFSVSEVVIHQGKGDLGILTGAKMLEFYKEILTDLDGLETASEVLKKAGKIIEDAGEVFEIVWQALKALNENNNRLTILAWVYFNLARVAGEQVNFEIDADGEVLSPDENYSWDRIEKALRKSVHGKITASEIKLARVMLMSKLAVVLRIKGANIEEVLHIAKSCVV